MAGTLLHITLATRALNRSRIPAEYRKKITKNPSDYRLGSILVDLPYYENVVVSGLRSLAGMDLHYNPWGTLLHLRAPGELGVALFETRTGHPGIHLALGYLTHLAVDVIFHREIHNRVCREADGSRSLDAEHKRIEDEMDLHIHYDILESPGIGTPYAGQMLNLFPNPGWAIQTSKAIARIHGNTIKPKTLEGWRTQVAAYGFLCSSKWAPWINTLPEDNPQLHATSLALAEEAIELAAHYLETGFAFATRGMDRAHFLEVIGNQSMLDGGPSAARRSPEY